jgi:predicted nucleic-acid-binding Zn-ribbon protein
MPSEITGVNPQVKRVDVMHCKKCDWRGPESDMGLMRTLMGDGFYHGKCPKCEAKNMLFVHEIETVSGQFVLVPVESK